MRHYHQHTRFDYGHAQLKDVKTYGVRSSSTGRVTITGIEIHGELFAPSLCFWRSFLNRFEVPTDVLKWFGPSEVFERVQGNHGEQEFRYCVQRDEQGTDTIMVVCGRLEKWSRSHN